MDAMGSRSSRTEPETVVDPLARRRRRRRLERDEARPRDASRRLAPAVNAEQVVEAGLPSAGTPTSSSRDYERPTAGRPCLGRDFRTLPLPIAWQELRASTGTRARA